MNNIIDINIINIKKNAQNEFIYKEQYIKNHLNRGYLKKRVNKKVTRITLTDESRATLEAQLKLYQLINEKLFGIYIEVMNNQQLIEDYNFELLNFYEIIELLKKDPKLIDTMRQNLNPKRSKIDFIFKFITSCYEEKLDKTKTNEELNELRYMFKKWLSVEKFKLMDSQSWKNQLQVYKKIKSLSQEELNEDFNHSLKNFNLENFQKLDISVNQYLRENIITEDYITSIEKYCYQMIASILSENKKVDEEYIKNKFLEKTNWTLKKLNME